MGTNQDVDFCSSCEQFVHWEEHKCKINKGERKDGDNKTNAM